MQNLLYHILIISGFVILFGVLYLWANPWVIPESTKPFKNILRKEPKGTAKYRPRK
jgi:hypothetical protein